MQQIWDISPPVSAQAPVFPGDTPYSQRWSATLGPGCPVNVSQITMSPHVGAHADAPLHYSADGKAAGRLPLAPFIGPCRVIHCMHGRALITPDDVQPFLADVPQRVLVRTCERANILAWSSQFTAFAAETIALLADLGVLLVGLDTPSIDPADSKDLPSHQAILNYDMRVLENLVLDDVAAGDYELIALPLALIDADASPVRAILRALPTSTPS
ncbi:MAG TPA: arylformamidase [Burkholderiaceae bacterium]|nr:arylformamidase [Burkholderiaceae bacterium]